MIGAMTQCVREFAHAATPWLIGAAAGLFLLGLVLAIWERKPLAAGGILLSLRRRRFNAKKNVG